MRAVVLTAALAALLGCDNTIQPLVEGSEEGFTLYGYLDTRADTQYVRLDPVQTSVLAGRRTLEDVLVVSTADDDDPVVWTYRRMPLEDGSLGEFYYAVFTPEAGRRYRLRAETGSGAVTEAVVTIPEPPVVNPRPARGDTAHLVQSVEILGVQQNPHRLVVVYEVRPPGEEVPVKVSVDYGQGNNRVTGGWAFDVFLVRDKATVLVSLNRNPQDRNVALVSIGVHARLLSPEWEQPDEAANITTGRGFFGALAEYDLRWDLPTSVVETMGFVDGQ